MDTRSSLKGFFISLVLALVIGARTVQAEVTIQSEIDPYDFVKVLVRGIEINHATEIWNLRDLVGKEYIEQFKEIFFSKFISEYPELKNLPKERFKDIFTFEIAPTNVSSGEISGKTLFRLNLYKDKGIPISTGIEFYFYHGNSKMTLNNDGRHPTLVENKKLSNLLPFLNPETEKQALEGLLAKAIDGEKNFQKMIKSGQMKVLLETKYPDLKVFFHLDEILKLATQNPEALTNYMREEILNTEQSLKSIVTTHQGELREKELKLGQIKKEIENIQVHLDYARNEKQAIDAQIAQLNGEKKSSQEEIQNLKGLV